VDPGEVVRVFYDELGEREWDRLIASPRGRVSLEIHRRFLAGLINPVGEYLRWERVPGALRSSLRDSVREP
jgi:hypothetical protein